MIINHIIVGNVEIFRNYLFEMLKFKEIARERQNTKMVKTIVMHVTE